MNLNFNKLNGLVPAVIQDNVTGKVLMLGFMNEEAFLKTQELGKVTFFSRTKNRLWTKGEQSGNFLYVVSIKEDCDKDTLLIKVNPVGPVCHTGADTCWDEKNVADVRSLIFLQEFLLKNRKENNSLKVLDEDVNRLAQMLGESAVTTVLEATNGTDERLLSEASDLLYNLMVLLASRGYGIENLMEEVKKISLSLSEQK